MATGELILPLGMAVLDGTSPPGILYQQNRLKLLFDASTDEIIYLTLRCPSNYASAPVLKVQYLMASATSGAVVHSCEVMAVSDDDAADVDSDSYDTANTATTTVPGTAGFLDEASITLTNTDSLAAGDLMTLKYRRDANHASDDAAGDMELINLSFQYTTT